MVATKAALSIRVDALTDSEGKSEPTAPTIGMENRAKLESRLRALEYQGDLAGIRSFANPSSNKQKKFEMNAAVPTYNTTADAVDLMPTQRDEDLAPAERAVRAVLDVKAEKKRAKEERRKERKEKKVEEEVAVDTNGTMDVDSSPAKLDSAGKNEETAEARAERKRRKKEAKEAKKAIKAAKQAAKEEAEVAKEPKVNGEANGDSKVEKKKKRKRDDDEQQPVEEQTKEKKKKKHKE